MTIDLQCNGQTPTRHHNVSEAFITRLDAWITAQDADMIITVIEMDSEGIPIDECRETDACMCPSCAWIDSRPQS